VYLVKGTIGQHIKGKATWRKRVPWKCLQGVSARRNPKTTILLKTGHVGPTRATTKIHVIECATMDEQPTSNYRHGTQQDTKLPRKRGQCTVGQFFTRRGTTATRALSRMKYHLLQVQTTGAFHEGLPQKMIKLSEPSARQRQLRMEWPWFRNRVPNPHGNNWTKHGITSQGSAQGNDPGRKKWSGWSTRTVWGFSISLIRSALVRHIGNGNVYILARKSMTVHFYTHSIVKRAKGVALVDSGATENLMNLQYMQWLRLPIKKLAYEWNLFNVDGTENKSGKLKYYMDLEVQTGTNKTCMRFFLMDLGEHKAILRYSWFVAVQPKINWKQGWIDASYLPIILQTDNAGKAKYLARTINILRPIHWAQYYLGKVTIEMATKEELKEVPAEYEQHSKVFSEKESQQLPNHMV
jgi:hypothetical protein